MKLHFRFKLFGFGFFLLGFNSAWAIIGDSVRGVLPGNAPSVCLITFRQSEREVFCSGALITPTQVITAGHCFGRRQNVNLRSISIQCGGEQLSRAVRVITPDPYDDRLWLNDNQPTHAHDQATIEMMWPALNAPVSRARAESDYFGSNTALIPGVLCRMLGFGTDNSGYMGNLNEADLSNVAMNSLDRVPSGLEGEVIYLGPRGTDYLPLSADHGDSGGPLLCRRPGEREQLVGTISGYVCGQSTGRRLWNYITPAWPPVN
ncbi:MAG: trypsin-like serine protease [Bdellovibrionales bacterium]|nr:trypsin-like serine protease [Oligoflexia bacterium]